MAPLSRHPSFLPTLPVGRFECIRPHLRAVLALRPCFCSAFCPARLPRLLYLRQHLLTELIKHLSP